jgi:hypothetical protein
VDFNENKVVVTALANDKYLADDNYLHRPQHHLDWYTIPVLTVDNPVKVYIGNDDDSDFLGNTVLIQETKTDYIFVGNKYVYRFTPVAAIDEYYSPIGPRCIPFPYAVDMLGNMYLMIEDVYFNRDQLGDFDDPYERYYRIRRINNEGDEFLNYAEQVGLEEMWLVDHTRPMNCSKIYTWHAH